MSGLDDPTGPVHLTPRGRPRRAGRDVLLALAAVLAIAALTVGWLRYIGSVTPATAVANAPTTTPAAPTARGPTTPGDLKPATTDSTGAVIPAAVSADARRVNTALLAHDISTVESCYTPDLRARVAPWPAVAGRVASPMTRQGLLAALRTLPTRPGDIAYPFAYDILGIGLRTDGKVAFFGTGHDYTPPPAASSSAVAAPAAGVELVLGVPSWALRVVGFKVTRSDEMNANGDGTSYVDPPRWSSRGEPTSQDAHTNQSAIRLVSKTTGVKA